MVIRASRSRNRGAAMVEAICVISVFILFFLGMLYFEGLYHQKIRVQQLARAAAVAYAMDACNDANPLQAVQQDLGNTNGANNPPPAAPTATVSVNQPSRPIGKQGADPLGSAVASKGFTGDKITDIAISGKAGSSTQNGAAGRRYGFQSDVHSDSFMSCGDPQEQGSAGGFIGMVKSLFN